MAFSLACFEIRSRKRRRLILHETAFTRWRFLLPTLSTLILFICFWTDLVRALATARNTSAVVCLNTRKFKGLLTIPEKVHHCQRSKKWFTWHVISIMTENKPHAPHMQEAFAYNESLQHPIISVLLIKILIFSDHSVVFTCYKVINAFKR